MPHVLLIRSLDDGLSTALALKARGIESSHYPLFTPHFLSLPELKNPQAFIVTSKNGVRAIVRGMSKHNISVIAPPPPIKGGRSNPVNNFLLDRDALPEGGLAMTWNHLPLYTVGDKTAELATQHGFSNILNASGTSADLIKLILKTAHPQKGVLWHLSGRETKGNVVESLAAEGFEAKRHIVYEIEDAPELSASLCMNLKEQSFSHVILCSPRTTQVFMTLLKNQNLEEVTRQITALCLSQEIAEKASNLSWKNIWISPQPHLNTLIKYFSTG
jgi:uroporphyrinogen-III synthase